MSAQRRGITVIIQADGASASRTYRISRWQLRFALGASAAFLLFAIALVLLYGPVLRAAARVPGLERERARLRSENGRIRQLAAALDSVESRYAQVREMVGGDIVREPVRVASTLPIAPTLRAVPAGAPPRFAANAPDAPPDHWPLDEPGYLTRGQVSVAGAEKDETHPGIDIAMAVGSVVRAAGRATVSDAGEDPQYGLYVLLQHGQGYQTMYGHLSRLLVTKGQAVDPGAVLGLTGNSGRSSAPHLHFEVRHEGQSIDPLSVVKEDR